MRHYIASLNLIWTLTWMSFMPRNRRDGLKLFWVFMEPAGQLIVMMLVFNLIGRTAGYGLSFAFFMMTGIVMLNLWNAGSRNVMGAVLKLENRARLAQVSFVHAASAQTVFSVLVGLGYTSIIAYAIGVYEHIETRPHHFEIAAQAFFWCGLLALGFGLLRAVAVKIAPAAHKVYNILTRAMIFITGIFYVPSFMPPQIRDMLWYNPVLHAVELLRLGMYDQYPTTVYSPLYLQFWALGTVAAGAALVWVNRSKFYG